MSEGDVWNVDGGGGNEPSTEEKKKELDEINRCQKETNGMSMEEAATNLQRKKRKRGQTTITNMRKDNSKLIEGYITTITKDHEVSLEKFPEVKTVQRDGKDQV